MDDVMRALRVGIGGVRYEANSFAAGVAGMECFTRTYRRIGAEVLAAEPNTEIFGAIAVANQRECTLVGLLDTFGGCGPLVEHDVYLELKRAFLEELSRELPTLDAVYLVLHGAMATTRISDAEGDFVSEVRALVGPDMPIVVSQDLHGAPSEQLIAATNALIGFKTCPHTDYEPTGAKSLTVALDAALGLINPVTLRLPIPMLTPAEGHDTAAGPMSAPMNAIQAEASARGLIDESVFMCQPWLDAERAGWCLTAVIDGSVDRAPVESLLAEHAARLFGLRESFAVEKLSVDDSMRTLVSWGPGPTVILAEGGDSPSAGSSGDTTELLAAIVALDDPRPRLALVTDAAAAAELVEAGIGATCTVSVGGRLSPRFAEPVTLTGEVLAISDGKFISEYPAGPTDIGPTVALAVGATTIVVCSRSAMMLDQGAYRHIGLDPSAAWAVQVKSAGGFRALWAPVSERVITVDARGASDGNLARLPFAHAPSHLWPLSRKAYP